MNPRHAPGRCPFCGEPLQVEALRCTGCRTRIEGRFDLLPFHRLSPDELRFLLRFLQHWGNLSRLSREMGVSYPTVRARYRDLLARMGLPSLPEEPTEAEKAPPAPDQVLAALERGEISVEEALQRLKGEGA